MSEREAENDFTQPVSNPEQEPTVAPTHADPIVIDGVEVGFIDHDGNIRLNASGRSHNKIIGHIANDRDHAIAVLRDRYLTYLKEIEDWCAETRTAENRTWRIGECDRRMREIDQQFVLGDFAPVRTLLTDLKADLIQEQDSRLAQRKIMIENASQLKLRTDWKDAGIAFDELDKAFQAVGPTGDREQDQHQWDAFKGHEREFRAKRKAHFDQIDREFGERRQQKQALCELTEQLQESTDFRAAGQQMRDLMDQWKQIGFAGKEHDEALWQRFQAARGVFNERRNEWFSNNARLKQELTEKAEALSELEDAADAQFQMKPLMQQWREIGSAGRDTDNALWIRFRAAQESVYHRSRVVFDQRREERQQNYDAKQALIAEAESLLGKESQAATNRAKELQQEWKNIGPVPHDLNERQWQRFRATCDSIFRVAEAEGRRKIEDARDRAEDHIRKLSSEIDEHERKISHWESVIANLGDGEDTDEIRQSMDEKIATARERIEIKLGWIEDQYQRMGELGNKL